MWGSFGQYVDHCAFVFLPLHEGFAEFLQNEHGKPNKDQSEGGEDQGDKEQATAERVMNYEEWLQEVHKSEVVKAEDEDRVLCPFSKEGINEITEQLQGGLRKLGAGSGLDLLGFRITERPNGTKAVKIVQSTPGTVELNLGGHIVIIPSGASMAVNESTMIPLGASHGLQVFLDGSKVNKIDRSGMSLGWCIPTLKTPDDKNTAEAESLAAIPQDTQKNKRRKTLTLAKPNKVITHSLAFESHDFIITLKSLSVQSESAPETITVTLNLPVLKPRVPPPDDALGHELCREAFKWPQELVEELRKTKALKTAKVFAVL